MKESPAHQDSPIRALTGALRVDEGSGLGVSRPAISGQRWRPHAAHGSP
ncbi:hypothetical protein [Nocardia mangyaensis]|nr:hypothetical protein [Nocardia mangyaensis]MDO3646436.1 hypothetical protein [Nocardia mangyaensis]